MESSGQLHECDFFFLLKGYSFSNFSLEKKSESNLQLNQTIKNCFSIIRANSFLFCGEILGNWELGVGNPWGCYNVSRDVGLFFFFFFGLACGMWKFLGQGLNLCHSSDLSCCSNNGRSLTHCTSRELQREFQLWLSGLRTWCCLRKNAGFIPGLTQWVKGPMLPLLWLWCRPQL